MAANGRFFVARIGEDSMQVIIGEAVATVRTWPDSSERDRIAHVAHETTQIHAESYLASDWLSFGRRAEPFGASPLSAQHE